MNDEKGTAMMRDCDFSRIEARHDAVNLRLEQWARWVTPRHHPWKTQPMFRLYKAPPQWEMPQIHAAANTLECAEVEKIVSYWLPEKHRDAVRWAYVFPWVPVNRVQRELAVTRAGLMELLLNGRNMVKNRLAQHLTTC